MAATPLSGGGLRSGGASCRCGSWPQPCSHRGESQPGDTSCRRGGGSWLQLRSGNGNLALAARRPETAVDHGCDSALANGTSIGRRGTAPAARRGSSARRGRDMAFPRDGVGSARSCRAGEASAWQLQARMPRTIAPAAARCGPVGGLDWSPSTTRRITALRAQWGQLSGDTAPAPGKPPSNRWRVTGAVLGELPSPPNLRRGTSAFPPTPGELRSPPDSWRVMGATPPAPGGQPPPAIPWRVAGAAASTPGEPPPNPPRATPSAPGRQPSPASRWRVMGVAPSAPGGLRLPVGPWRCVGSGPVPAFRAGPVLGASGSAAGCR